jgi:ATP-dependent DNA helicase DinG
MRFAVLDFETTGSGPDDHIIQVGLVTVEGNEIKQRYSSLVNPDMPIPTYITQLTGITDDMVQEAPLIDTVITDMLPYLKDHILVGHHIAFDLGFLQRALDQCGYSLYDGMVLDTMTTLRICYPGLSSLQLNMICAALDIPHMRPHQADSDAEATAEVWLKCLDRLENLPLLTIQRLSQLYSAEAQVQDADFAWFLHELRNQRELQTSIDLDSAKYFRQFALDVSDWQEEEAYRLDPEQKLEDTFEKFYEGIKKSLQQEYTDFEERSSQDQMVQEVHDAFDQERHLMIEAGTGTGKSLGYLIPSLYYGITQQQKVIISTHTINLQEQIRQRDIPLLQRIFPVPFRASVLKGRSHYLCLRKFENKINTQDFEHLKEDTLTAAQMIVWLGETGHGDEEELHFGNKGNQFWNSVASDTDSCLNRACPWFKKCFYHRARHEAAVADAVITNHSMLFTDVKADHRLLPAYEHLVIDEAHHFEEVANKHLGLDIQYFGFVNTLTWLFKDSRNGLLPALKSRLQHNEDDQSKDWCKEIDESFPKLVKIKEEWDQLTDLLYQLLMDRSDQVPDVGQVMRMKPDQLPSQWETLLTVEDNIFIELNGLLKRLDRMLSEMKEEQDSYDLQSLTTDLGGIVKDMYKHRDALHFFMKMNDEDYVYWMEASPLYKSKSLQLISVPVDVSSMLRQYFFANKESIILTSATISVDRSFQYISEQLGLASDAESGKLITVQLPSPFNYRNQALVCIPRDFPKVKGAAGDAEFIERLTDSLRDVAMETRGRMLVLFTSYRMLKQVHERLKPELQTSGIEVLGQGIDSGNRSKLTHMFRKGSASVLLGTSSFWEGVDIPGEALSCLAIVRLPFQPPNHPLVEAKSDMLKKQKMNPFMKLSVPQAVIRFKQGFGRLVRKTTDRGIVIIYDTRVIDTQYGKYFLYSLPGPKIEHMPTEQMVPRIQEWFRGYNDEKA